MERLERERNDFSRNYTSLGWFVNSNSECHCYYAIISFVLGVVGKYGLPLYIKVSLALKHTALVRLCASS